MTTDSWDDAAIAIASLDTGEHRILIEGGTSPRYVPTGHILFARDGSLLAAPFDLDRLEVIGAPVTVVDGVITNPLNGSSFYDVADDGTLATMRGGSQPSVRQLLWVDREGIASPLPLEPLPVMRVDVSPDGTSLALDVESALADVWSYELDRDVMTRLTFGLNILLGWSADGTQVLFSSLSEQRILRTNVDASSAPEQLVAGQAWSASWSPDGQTLAYVLEDPTTASDIWLLSAEGESEPQAFVRTSFDERMPEFSPDGR